ncbi:CcmA ABC-type multidrug transport system, ATPase component [Candidatus Nanopelagicaceae bacterium]
MQQSNYAIQTQGLTKSFGSHNAVDAIDLQVPRGSIFGFLGPNGSGKTTTIRMLLGLAEPSAGSISVLGRAIPDNAGDALPHVGALVEGPAFYPYLSGRDNLARFDSADSSADPKTRAARIESALARVGLTAAREKKVHAYSLGMKQRLGIANALLQPRELLILDEPTNGLDPQGTREVRTLIRDLASQGITIFISSHLLLEIEQICSHLAVMSAGKIVAQGSIEELSFSEILNLNLRTPDTDKAIATLNSLDIEARNEGGAIKANIIHNFIAPEVIVAALVRADVKIQGFTLEAPKLEERFVSLTGEGFDVAR